MYYNFEILILKHFGKVVNFYLVLLDKVNLSRHQRWAILMKFRHNFTELEMIKWPFCSVLELISVIRSANNYIQVAYGNNVHLNVIRLQHNSSFDDYHVLFPNFHHNRRLSDHTLYTDCHLEFPKCLRLIPKSLRRIPSPNRSR